MGGIDIIASAAEPSHIRPGQPPLYCMYEPETFSLYNRTEDWHSIQDTNSTGVRFIEKFI
jgi:hypothetical protein